MNGAFPNHSAGVVTVKPGDTIEVGVCIKIRKAFGKDYENKFFFFTSFCEFFLLYRGDDTMYDVSSSSF